MAFKWYCIILLEFLLRHYLRRPLVEDGCTFILMEGCCIYMQKALLILYLPVDLVPGPTLNLADGADGAYRSLGVAEFVSIDEVS